MIRQGAYPKVIDTRWSILYTISGVAALIAGALLLLGAVSQIVTAINPGALTGLIAPFEKIWLMTIFRLQAGFGDANIDQMQGLHLLDMAVLLLVGIVCLGLFAALYRTSKFLSVLALVQPFLGLLLYIVTQEAGRSAVMGAALVISIVMRKGKVFSKITALAGIVVSVLLLIGDFTAGVLSSPLIAGLFGIAYLLFVIWFILIARKLFQLGRLEESQIVAHP